MSLHARLMFPCLQTHKGIGVAASDTKDDEGLKFRKVMLHQ